jgi:hypothetical protein
MLLVVFHQTTYFKPQMILVICMYVHNKRFIAASSKGNRTEYIS